MIRISNIRIPLEGIDDVPEHAARQIDVPVGDIVAWRFVRRSVDARHHHRPVFVITVDVDLRNQEGWLRSRGIATSEPVSATRVNLPPGIQIVFESRWDAPSPGDTPIATRPVVIGAGPAGLFAALTLARAGLAPILLERGDTVESRVDAVSRFLGGGALDPDSNVQFGEGGAGTFSDGKLTTRINDPRCEHVLKTLVAAGAPESIQWEHLPHVGTDRLRDVVPRITEMIRQAGGDVRFRSRVQRVIFADNKSVRGVDVDGFGRVEATAVILATGHSARDTFRSLAADGVDMKAKSFAVGMRIEHPQEVIDQAQYGAFAGHPALPPASYRLAVQVSGERSAWSFCMCPGGTIINASSEPDGVVTNGMSTLARDGLMANSAIVVNVGPGDFPEPGPLGGVAFQQKIERAAFFAAARGSVRHRGGIPYTTVGKIADGAPYLPDFITGTLSAALPLMGKRIRGFDLPATAMLGPETRTSSPVRIVRDDNCVAVNNPGLYPCGEGAGYAGGIVSAAVDGIRVAESVIGGQTLPIAL